MDVVILPNQFSRAGVSQLEFDCTTGILPIFSDNGVNCKIFFGSVSSALIILQLSTGEAMLLYDTLQSENFEDRELALTELDVTICQSEVIKVIKSRCDLRI